MATNPKRFSPAVPTTVSDDSAPSVPEVSKPKPKPIPKPRVTIQNELSQLVTLSVTDEDGKPIEIKLGPNESSSPVEESKLTSYTKQLANLGHLRIRRV